MAATTDLNRVAVTVEVIERGSFTAAAAALGAPKSSVSRSVAALEKELGVTLLKRTTRKLALTEVGRTWFERVRGALAELEQASAEVSCRERAPGGVVRMTAPPDMGAPLLDVLMSFHALYPQVHVEVLLTGRRMDLVEEGVDLALRAGRLSDSALIARKLYSTDLKLYAAPGYLERHGRPKTVAELGRHACVLFRASSGRTVWQLSGPHNRTAKVQVTGPISTDSMGFVVDAAVAGMGVALVPALRCDALLAEKRLEHVLPAWMITGASLYLVHAASTFLPRRVELLRDHLVDKLGRGAISPRR